MDENKTLSGIPTTEASTGKEAKENKGRQGSHQSTRSNRRNNRRSGNGNNKGSENVSPKEEGQKTPKEKRFGPPKNDWRFYAPSELIAQQIGALPWNYLSGDLLPVTFDYSFSNIEVQYPIASSNKVASLMGARIPYLPSIGVSDKASDAISMAANQLYAVDRLLNTGAKVYESPDLMMYVVAMGEIYRQMIECRRAILFANNYQYYNKYFPKFVIEELMHIDYYDLFEHKADYTAQFNILVQRVNSFAIPQYFKFLQRAAYIAGNIFMDSDAITGQVLVFDSIGTYTFDTTGSDKGTQLKYTPKYNDSGAVHTQITLKHRFDGIMSQLDAIMTDVDAQTMSGDILKRFGSSGIYSLDEISVNDTLSPVYDQDIMAQVENMTIIPIQGEDLSSAQIGISWNITQDAGHIIKFTPAFKIQQGAVSLKTRIFNSHVTSPNYQNVLEWSRLMVSGKILGDVSLNEFLVTSCGLEIPLAFESITRLEYVDYDTVDNTRSPITTEEINRVFVRQVNPQAYTKYDPDPSPMGTAGVAQTMQFDWHPLLYFITSAEVHDNVRRQRLFIGGDLKFPTIITDTNIESINKAAVYASFYDADLFSKFHA